LRTRTALRGRRHESSAKPPARHHVGQLVGVHADGRGDVLHVRAAALAAGPGPAFLKGKPVPDDLPGDVDALTWMKSDERDERLEKLDELYEEYASSYAVYHPIRDEG
jgi:hypothetical protein